MGTQEYIVFALAAVSVAYLAFRFYKKNLKKKAAKSGCSTDCDC